MEDQSYKEGSGPDGYWPLGGYSGGDQGGYSEDVRVVFGDDGM